MGFVVAIDGPAGSGKGTVTKLVAEKKGLVAIDTGAMYRCVTLDCLNKNIEPSNIEGIKKVLENIDIELKNEDGKPTVYLNGDNVTREIRETKVNDNVSEFAAIKLIRDKITPIQQKMGETQDIIMEGRDICTVVFPNADIKIFLDCSLEERAMRRYKENLGMEINSSFEEILENIKKREKINMERETAPFVKAEDAVLIDSTNMTIDEVVEKICEMIDAKRN